MIKALFMLGLILANPVKKQGLFNHLLRTHLCWVGFTTLYLNQN